ncbi:MAG: TIGR02221 family CRISPR-associated protein [Thiotrichales bacterium]
MPTTLITFLGRVKKEEEGAYRCTSYSFPDGNNPEPLAFFGWALLERIKPDNLVVLGTDGSMWDHLFEGDIDLGGHSEEERTALIDAVENQAVRQSQLDELAPVLAAHLGCTVRLQLIPYCRDEAEQVTLLKIMNDHIDDRERVHLDVTHGFRHLPMIALLSALHLQLTKDAEIKGIWYGSFDPDTKKAPVMELSGLLRIAGWLQSLSSFDKDGDYRSFIPLLRSGGLGEPALENLSKAGYYENILNVGEATGQLRQALTKISDPQSKLSPDTALLMPLINERLNWIAEDRQFEKQLHLAQHALERKDYLRTTLYAYEAVITRLCQLDNVNIDNFPAREATRRDYEGRLNRQQDSTESLLYKQLKNLRNQVAHGTRGDVAETQKILLNEPRLQTALATILSHIDNQTLPSAPPG